MEYTIKKGDNLSKIAKDSGLKLTDIIKANSNIYDPDYIQVGQKINIPDKNKYVTLKNNTSKSYSEFLEDQVKLPDSKPTWNKLTPNAGSAIQKRTQIETSKSSPKKLVSKNTPKNNKNESSIFDDIKNQVYEIYSDIKTALDQQFSPKTITKPKIENAVEDVNIDYGYKELGTYKDQSFRAGKNDSLLSAINVFDNSKGFDYVVSPKLKEGLRTYNNVKGVAHFIMDGDITEGQKFTQPYQSKGQKISSSVPGKFINYTAHNPNDYVMYYKNGKDGKVNVKYGQLKDKSNFPGYDNIKVRSVDFSSLDFNKKTDAGFAKKASYIQKIDGNPTSIITDPSSDDVYGRFSGGSGIFLFKEPKTGKEIAVDISGSVNTIRKVGDDLAKKYNVDKKNMKFLYHDMGSYSAKPKSHNGRLSNSQWQNYNTNNKGYSGSALMYPMEHGGYVESRKAMFGMGGGNSGGGGMNFMNMFSGMMGGGGQQQAVSPQQQLTPDQIQEMELQKKKMMNQQLQYQQYQQQEAQMNYGNYIQNYREDMPMYIRGGKIYASNGYPDSQEFNPYENYQLNYNWQNYNNSYINNPYQELNYSNIKQDSNQAGANIQANTDAAQGVMGKMGGEQGGAQQEAFKGGGMFSTIGNSSYIYDFFKEHPEYLQQQHQNFNFYDVNPLQAQTDQMSTNNYNQYLQPITPMPAKKLEVQAPDMTGALSGIAKKDVEATDTQGLSKANIASMVGDVGLGLADTIGSVTKSDSPFGAAMRGGSKSVKVVDNITKPFEAIPGAKMVTAPLKAASFIFGSIMSAISQRIKNQEFQKAKDYRMYLDRNMVPLAMNRGQGGEYGLKIKTSLVDEIYSDFDKYLNSK